MFFFFFPPPPPPKKKLPPGICNQSHFSDIKAQSSERGEEEGEADD